MSCCTTYVYISIVNCKETGEITLLSITEIYRDLSCTEYELLHLENLVAGSRAYSATVSARVQPSEKGQEAAGWQAESKQRSRAEWETDDAESKGVHKGN